ncbi:MAG TPA: hypothetical protein PKE25_05345, partial [Novosphingobium sp.]|nr:hypothetical protein [Novosphingobium sp.]
AHIEPPPLPTITKSKVSSLTAIPSSKPCLDDMPPCRSLQYMDSHSLCWITRSPAQGASAGMGIGA